MEIQGKNFGKTMEIIEIMEIHGKKHDKPWKYMQTHVEFSTQNPGVSPLRQVATESKSSRSRAMVTLVPGTWRWTSGTLDWRS